MAHNYVIFVNELWRRHAPNFNIFILGISFMVFFSGFLPTNYIAPTVLSSVTHEDPHFTGDGYTSLSIIYIVLAAANWLSSSAVAVVGAKYTIIIGFCLLCTYTISFLKVATWSLYLTSVLVGFGGACVWTGHGALITSNSNDENISRNSGIFWAMFEFSLLFGSLVVYFEFLGLKHIDSDTRTSTFTTLLVVSIVGIFLLFFLRVPQSPTVQPDESAPSKRFANLDLAWSTLVGAFKLLFTKQMLILSATFVFTGLELAFFSAVYGTSVGFTQRFGSKAKELVALNGVLVGVGEIAGSVVFGVLGKWTLKFGRDVAFLCGYFIHLVSYYLIFLNLPNESPVHETKDCSYIAANMLLAMLCSFFLGFGDGCFNPQIISLLGSLYKDNCAPAFALYKFIQSVATSVSLFYTSQLQLRVQLFILVVSATFGLAAFCWAEWKWQISLKKLESIKSDSVVTTL